MNRPSMLASIAHGPVHVRTPKYGATWAFDDLCRHWVPPCATLDRPYWALLGGLLARVFLTGRLTVVGADGSFDEGDLPGTQGRVAFAALALHPSPLGRDQLADLVWGDDDLPDAWNAAINSLVSKIRRLLQGVGLDAKKTLIQMAGSYQLVLPTDIWIDVEDATRRLDRAEGARRHHDMSTAVSEATVAAAIFRRPFLPGADGRWVELVRDRHADMLYRSYEVLSDGWRENGDAGLGAAIAAKAIELDPFRESAYRLLMRAEATKGDRAAAILAYRRCRDVLRGELGVGLSSETEAIGRQLGRE